MKLSVGQVPGTFFLCEEGMHILHGLEVGHQVRRGKIDNYRVPNFYNSLISERYINNEKLSYGTLFCFISFTNIKLLLCAANMYVSI